MNFLIQKKGNSAIENEGYHDIILGTGDPNITWPAARNSKKHMVAAQFSSESEQSSFRASLIWRNTWRSTSSSIIGDKTGRQSVSVYVL